MITQATILYMVTKQSKPLRVGGVWSLYATRTSMIHFHLIPLLRARSRVVGEGGGEGGGGRVLP